MDQSYGIYNSGSVAKEVALSSEMLKERNGLAHFLNGERDVRFSTSLKNRRGWKFVATFHEPPDVIRKYITNFKYLKRLDGAIAVGINQQELLSEITGNKEIPFIPHGVDIDFFRPSQKDWNPHTCLLVGQHLRDFETLALAVEMIVKQCPQFQLNAVLNKEFVQFLPKLKNVNVFSGISDEQLLSLYQNASALIMPLKEVTACNAILEALASGLPVVSTRLQGNEIYLNDASALLTKSNDARALADAAIELMKNESLNRKMRSISREQSLQFSWQNVSATMKEYYKKFD
jgi:glycosyltransferase involved in cell wall biosynthesis